ncbi:MAG: urea ABC transporter ATP-binding protein UrtD [Chloroflexota bacterium]
MTDDGLVLRDIVVRFDGLTVLDHLSLALAPGEIRFVIGPNGAGKTTLLDVITGRTRPAQGEARFRGQDLTRMQEHQIARLGISRKFQTPTIFPSITVWENLEVAIAARSGLVGSVTRLPQSERERLQATLDLVGLSSQAGAVAGTLSHGQKQWLEIAMLQVVEPDVLLLDEPVAGMTRVERDQTVDLLNRLQETYPSRTVLIVEHDMAFVRQLARTVTVLHLGSLLSEGTMDAVQNDPRVIEAYLGHGKSHGRRRVA